jgi:hypothetical protein
MEFVTQTTRWAKRVALPGSPHATKRLMSYKPAAVLRYTFRTNLVEILRPKHLASSLAVSEIHAQRISEPIYIV